MKNEIILNYDAEFASEVMTEIPVGYINKTICGVGLSSVALENDVPTIIAVPNIHLIENKVTQYPNKRSNKSILGVWGDTTSEEIANYVRANPIIKIMVTYDSVDKVKELLVNPLSNVLFVIDESDLIIKTAGMKASSKKGAKSVDIMNNLLTIAESIKDRVSFISATPAPLTLLPKWVSEIPNITMNWSNTVTATPILLERAHPFKSLKTEIVMNLRNNGTVKIGSMEAKKLIIFINSVTEIVKICTDCNLPITDVGIVAANSVKNDCKLGKYNRLDNPNNLPKFTFVTSSGFQGMDLYDESAGIVVVSSTKKDFQMIDVSTSLKQAISRQRLKSNPNYGKFVLLYNQSIFNFDKDYLIKLIDTTYEQITNAIALWELAKLNKKESGFIYTESNADFKAYTIYNPETETYSVNELLFASDRHFILEVREQYTKGFAIKGIVESTFSSVEIEEPTELPVQEIPKLSYVELVKLILDETNKLKDFRKSFSEIADEYSYTLEHLEIITKSYEYFGVIWKDQSYAIKMVDNYKDTYKITVLTVRKTFNTGETYTAADVKSKLQLIYNKFNIKRTAKATDLHEFFFVKSCNKRIDGVLHKSVTIQRTK